MNKKTKRVPFHLLRQISVYYNSCYEKLNPSDFNKVEQIYCVIYCVSTEKNYCSHANFYMKERLLVHLSATHISPQAQYILIIWCSFGV